MLREQVERRVGEPGESRPAADFPWYAWVALGLASLALLLAGVLTCFDYANGDDWAVRGARGDFWGGHWAAATGLAGIFLAFAAFVMQRDELRRQSEQLELQRDELELTREEMRLQRRELAGSKRAQEELALRQAELVNAQQEATRALRDSAEAQRGAAELARQRERANRLRSLGSQVELRQADLAQLYSEFQEVQRRVQATLDDRRAGAGLKRAAQSARAQVDHHAQQLRCDLDKGLHERLRCEEVLSKMLWSAEARPNDAYIDSQAKSVSTWCREAWSNLQEARAYLRSEVPSELRPATER